MSDDLRPDIAEAKKRMRVKLGGGREIKRLTSYLWDGETVERMTTGAYGKGVGLVVLTDRRLLFVQDGMMSKTSEDFPIDKISSVQWSSAMVTGVITIFASGNKAEIKNVNKDDGREITDLIRARISGSSREAVAAPASSGGDDIASQIQKLGDLRDAGVLTEDEFSAKKADLLARM